MKKKEYRMAIFDLDDTLLDYHFEENSAVEFICSYITSIYKKEYKLCLKCYKEAKYESREKRPYDLRYRFFLLTDKLHLSMSTEDILYKYYLEARVRYSRILPGANDILERCPVPYKIIATNGYTNLQTMRVLKNLQKWNFKIYTSEFLKCKKPDSQFYKKIEEYESTDLSKCIVYGDSIINDLMYPYLKFARCILMQKGRIIFDRER